MAALHGSVGRGLLSRGVTFPTCWLASCIRLTVSIQVENLASCSRAISFLTFTGAVMRLLPWRRKWADRAKPHEKEAAVSNLSAEVNRLRPLLERLPTVAVPAPTMSAAPAPLAKQAAPASPPASVAAAAKPAVAKPAPPQPGPGKPSPAALTAIRKSQPPSPVSGTKRPSPNHHPFPPTKAKKSSRDD